MLNLVRRQLAHDWPLLLAVMLLLGTFEYLLCAMVGSVDVEGAFGEITRFAPPLVRDLIERNMPGGSPAAVLSFGWNHPVAHALLAAVAITLAARAIAAEVESGAIELVMAQPLSRAEYFLAYLAWAVVALCAAIAAGIAGMALGQRVFELPPFTGARMAALFVNALLLQLALYGIALLASAFAREAGRAALVGVLAAVVSFLVNVVATLWTRAAFAKPYSLHHYYEPREILADGRLATSSVVVLAVVATVTIAAAFARFARRDLP
jgi:ABC-2 type transport system permease protein